MKLSKDALMSSFEKMLAQFPESVEGDDMDAEEEGESYEEEGDGMEKEDSMEVERTGRKKKKHGLAHYMEQMASAE